MRRGITTGHKEEIHSAEDSGRLRNKQGKKFLPLSVEALVHSKRFVLRCLQCQYFKTMKWKH